MEFMRVQELTKAEFKQVASEHCPKCGQSKRIMDYCGGLVTICKCGKVHHLIVKDDGEIGHLEA